MPAAARDRARPDALQAGGGGCRGRQHRPRDPQRPPREGHARVSTSPMPKCARPGRLHPQPSKTRRNPRRAAAAGVDVADLQTGDVDGRQAIFHGAGNCASCHSPTGDLTGIATRLRRAWRSSSACSIRAAPKPTSPSTLPDGQSRLRRRWPTRTSSPSRCATPPAAIAPGPPATVKFTVSRRPKPTPTCSPQYSDARRPQPDGVPADPALSRKALSDEDSLSHPVPRCCSRHACRARRRYPAMLLVRPPADTWPGLPRRLLRPPPQRADARSLPRTSDGLGLAWAFQTGQNAPSSASPLLVDGVLYFTVPDNVWAVDARSGHQIWHYTYPPNKGLHIGHRGRRRCTRTGSSS